jgi:hypothetical protein
MTRENVFFAGMENPDDLTTLSPLALKAHGER